MHAGYKYAGLQHGNECWAGNAVGKYGQTKDSDCNMPCAMDNTRNCGASWKNHVYRVPKKGGKDAAPTSGSVGDMAAADGVTLGMGAPTMTAGAPMTITDSDADDADEGSSSGGTTSSFGLPRLGSPMSMQPVKMVMPTLSFDQKKMVGEIKLADDGPLITRRKIAVVTRKFISKKKQTALKR